MGLQREIPQKPVPFIFYEQVKELRLPLVDGGIEDQPHIWLMQYAVCMQRETLWRTINERAFAAPVEKAIQ